MGPTKRVTATTWFDDGPAMQVPGAIPAGTQRTFAIVLGCSFHYSTALHSRCHPAAIDGASSQSDRVQPEALRLKLPSLPRADQIGMARRWNALQQEKGTWRAVGDLNQCAEQFY